jgi:hypothetical protein
MTRQAINVGAAANDRTGDALRTAFQKTNSNFVELYDRVGTLETSGGNGDRSWEDVSTNQTYNVVEWNSGKTVTVTSTPTETYTLTTYDARSNSPYIYFVWDQQFITNVWEGYNHPFGGGEAYELSLDGGQTWFAVEQSGYNGGTFLYFSVAYAYEGQYTFTYLQGVNVQLRFNRGSLPTPWFDLADAPVNANSIITVSMDVVANPRMVGAGNTVFQATSFKSNLVFSNVLYNDNTSEGSVSTGSTTYSGNNSINSDMNMEIRLSSNTAVDAGRLYCDFDNGRVGTISFYWNAKLFTRS